MAHGVEDVATRAGRGWARSRSARPRTLRPPRVAFRPVAVGHLPAHADPQRAAATPGRTWTPSSAPPAGRAHRRARGSHRQPPAAHRGDCGSSAASASDRRPAEADRSARGMRTLLDRTARRGWRSRSGAPRARRRGQRHGPLPVLRHRDGPVAGTRVPRVRTDQSRAAPALARFARRPRIVWSRTTLRIRTELGVTSTHSSSAISSSACSSDSGARRDQLLHDLGRRRPDVVELLLLRRVDVHVVGPGVLPPRSSPRRPRRRAPRRAGPAPAATSARGRSSGRGGRPRATRCGGP